MIPDEMPCPECRQNMNITDSTTDPKGAPNGDIYYCEECEQYYLFVLKTGEIKTWEY